MYNALFGYTGLVGSNILIKYKFNYLYNSKNINDSKYKEFDTIFICCIPAVKWFSNKFPEKDSEDIENIKNIFKTIKTNKVILISTIDIYDNINNKSNENTLVEYNNNHTYGKNRYLFELFIKENFTNYNIIRLPALFGKGLKKNIIYDLLNNNNINIISTNTSFQWYNLEWLKDDIDICLNKNIKECNLFTEPLDTIHILKLFNYDYSNNPAILMSYDTQTKYSTFFISNTNGYIRNNQIVFNDIKNFINLQNKYKNENNKNNKLITNFNYKLCVSNISNNTLSNIQYYSILKYYDIKYIEIAPTKFYDWTTLFNDDNNDNQSKYEIMKQIIKETNEYNLNIYSFQSITFTINNNIFDKDNSDLLNHCKKVIDLACNNGIKNLVFGCPRNRKILGDDKLYNETIFINFMIELGNYINNRDLILSLENNSKLYNCNFLNTIDEVGEITLKINHHKIKIMVDIGNCLMENDNIENMIKYKGIINHIHISTAFMKPLNDVFINNNNEYIVYYKKFIDILKKINYDKVISLEFLNNDENNELVNLNESLYNFINLFNT
jgi:sugar phosphate isomerase/epimerase